MCLRGEQKQRTRAPVKRSITGSENDGVALSSPKERLMSSCCGLVQPETVRVRWSILDREDSVGDLGSRRFSTHLGIKGVLDWAEETLTTTTSNIITPICTCTKPAPTFSITCRFKSPLCLFPLQQTHPSLWTLAGRSSASTWVILPPSNSRKLRSCSTRFARQFYEDAHVY